MGHVNYQCLRGKVHSVAPAAPPTNPHLWVILEANGEQWFATINVRSDKDALGEPAGKSYLYYLVDSDFDHPFIASILARPEGLSAVERSFAGGALDFQRAGLFDPNAMRVLPPEGPGDDGLVQRLTGILQLAKDQECDVFFYGNAFTKDNPHQTDAALAIPLKRGSASTTSTWLRAIRRRSTCDCAKTASGMTAPHSSGTGGPSA